MLTDEQTKDFYNSPDWRRTRKEILRADKGECQICKAKGRYTKAVIVHHVNHLRDRPDLKLDKTYKDTNGITQRQLISVCRECHETVCHPERMREIAKPLTTERW